MKSQQKVVIHIPGWWIIVLQLILIVLKETGAISWGWPWVFAPTILYFFAPVVLIAVAVILLVVAALFNMLDD